SQSIIGRCLSRREAIRANNLPEEFPDSASVIELAVRSLLCAPLQTADGQALGAIQLDNFHRGRPFTDEDLRLLLGVAGQASVAVAAARLHREALAPQRGDHAPAVAPGGQPGPLPQAPPAGAGARLSGALPGGPAGGR